ncbi:pyridoxamine 5'-phosphate oxidase family protein [Enterococcus sp. AZ196]|uniref:pyridoxamine 5'-phosphate oxidase family protein n=1 Tax=Enterococcus sp. AZ196 TaxID=2774659 RepID=UPI003D2C9024
MSIYYMGSLADLPQEFTEEVNNFVQKGIPVFTETGVESHTVMLGTKQDQHVRLSVINLLQDSKLCGIYMQTNRNSQKVKNLLACNTAEIAITNGFGYVVLECSGEVIEDDQRKKEKWEEWMTEFHPEGPLSADYVLLHFKPHAIRAML